MHVTFDPTTPQSAEITFEDYMRVDIRVGRIVVAEPFPEARKPAYKLTIDFGSSIGRKRSSAQITEQYDIEALKGRRILAVVNFPPRQIGPVKSEVLVLGAANEAGEICLVAPDSDVPIGARLL